MKFWKKNTIKKIVHYGTLMVSLLSVLLIPSKSIYAVVAFDVATESHTGTTGNSGAASFTISHNPSGVPGGILVFVYTISATKTVTGVTYDGEAMTEVTGGAAIDAATEPARVDTFFMGSGVNTTDPANVVISRTNNAVVMYAVSISVTADADTSTNGIVLLQDDGSIAEQNVTDGSPGTNSVRFAGGYTGAANPPSAGANSTLLHDIDFGAFGVTSVRETNAGQGSRPVGMTAGSDDRAVVHLAVRDSSSPPTVATRFASNSGNTTALLNGTIVTAGTTNVTVRGFAYGTSATLGTVIATTTDTTGQPFSAGEFSGGVSSLSANTTYYFRAYATSNGGTAFGAIQSFITNNGLVTRKIRLFDSGRIRFTSGKVRQYQR